jgi:uncharacterized protein
LMFAFTLGTSVLFFAVAYLATQLGARLEKLFMTFVAIVVLIFGFVTLNSGLNLMGSPISYENLTRNLFRVEQTVARQEPSSSDPSPSADGQLILQVKNNGYFPETLYARANQPTTLTMITQNTVSCSRDFVIPALDYYALLPSTGQETVEIPPQEPGTIIRFTCSMGMYTGQIEFD